MQKSVKLVYSLIVCLAGIFLFGMLMIEGKIIYASHVLEGKGTEESPFLIENEEDYVLFAQSVNEGTHYEGQQVLLTDDLDYSLINVMVGIEGSSDSYFAGIFDGGGHKISNVNIKTEGAAGLFVNLSGMIVNLQVESGTVAGSYAGGIAGSVYGNANIYNCCNKANIIGQTENGIIGKFVGNMSNCYSKGDESEDAIIIESDPIAYAGYLNAQLDALSVGNQYHKWCKWVVENGELSLSNEYMNVLDIMKTEIHVSGNIMTMQAYAGSDSNWYFAFPAGYDQQEEKEIMLAFQNGDMIRTTFSKGQVEGEVSYENRNYHIICLTNENIPTMMLSTSHAQSVQYLNASKENVLNGGVSAFDEKGELSYHGVLSEVSGRGNDSWLSGSKKGYNITLKDSVDLFGMGANEDYVLAPGYRDNSLLSYKVTEDMEKEIGITFAPESRYVSLYIDNQYMGMYLLTEKIELDQNRYEISDVKLRTKQVNANSLDSYEQKSENGKTWYEIPNDPEDITGGYVLEIDCNDYTLDQSRFKSTRGNVLTLKSDKYASKAQVTYLAEYWQDFEDAVFSEDGYNDKGIYYTEYIDVESFADQWLMYELNSESSMTSSIYVYKESVVNGDGLLHAGYVWDVEHSYLSSTRRLNIAARKYKDLDGYWVALYRHEDFAEKVSEEWTNKYLPAIEKLLQEAEVENSEGLSSMSWYQQEYEVSASINETRWAGCDWNDKVSSIRQFLIEKKNFLTYVLPKYELPYDYIFVEGGYVYGANFNKTVDGEIDEDDIELVILEEYPIKD